MLEGRGQGGERRFVRYRGSGIVRHDCRLLLGVTEERLEEWWSLTHRRRGKGAS